MNRFLKQAVASVAMVVSLGASAAIAELTHRDIGKVVPVEFVEAELITQVVVFDGYKTSVLITGQEVEDRVLVTTEMANNAFPFSLSNPKFPEIYTVGQIPNANESEGTNTPFLRTGDLEPIMTNRTIMRKVYFQVGKDTYSYETTENIGKKVKLTKELLLKAKKVV